MAKRLLALSAWFAVMWMVAVLIFAPEGAVKTTKLVDAENASTIIVLAENGEDTVVEQEEIVEQTHTFGSRIEEWFSKNFLEVGVPMEIT